MPTGGANGIMLFDGKSGTEVDQIERNIDRAYLGAYPFVIGNKRAFIEGDFELYPPATPGQASTSDADCGPLLLPAGTAITKDAGAKTSRYNPISAAIAISDAYWWHAGTHKQVLAARHVITQLGITIGDRFKGHVRVQGDYTDVLEAALPAITLPSNVPVVATAANTTCKIDVLPIGSPLTVWAKSLTLDFGSTLAQKEYTTHKETGLSDRRPTWTLRLARTAKADFDPWAVRDAGTLLVASLRLTQAANLYSELGVRGQIEAINETEIDGDYGWELTGRAIPSDAGGDEFYVEFGDTTA
ncbi:MAG TPA: hypothetical protein VGC79_17425 [Polyangiaceae bacterium]